jgi:RecB family exonuclease
VADRIDLLGDGTVHVLDYKLGRPPKPSRALQVPVYGLAAEQQLSAARARRWTFTEGGYLAFAERDVFVAVVTPDTRGREMLEASQQRLMDAVEALERGAFPPRPDERGLCETCPFPQVCRKDYVER